MKKTYWLAFALMMQLGFSQIEVQQIEQTEQTEDKEEVDVEKPPNILLILVDFIEFSFKNPIFVIQLKGEPQIKKII